jgi:hypothetical protein
MEYEAFDVYRYDKLQSSDHIRLLTIGPELGQDGLVACSLEESPLTVEYTCLSYMWGKATGLKIILIDGLRFVVRRNLWNFLVHARQNMATEKLWIDAVCINQRDTAERSSQVSMMASIYAKSSAVFVYLGHGRPQVAVAVKWTRRLSSGTELPLPQPGPLRWKPFLGTMEYKAFKTSYTADPPKPSADIQIGLKQLYQLAYWTRAWIKQELLLHTNITFFYQGSTCSMADLLVLSDCVTSDSQIWDSVHRLDSFKLTSTIGRQSDEQTLLELIIHYSTSQCTNFHDHVYAFLSLSEDGRDFPVDYKLSKLELWLLTLARTHTGVAYDSENNLCTTGVRLFHTLDMFMEDLHQVQLETAVRGLNLEGWHLQLHLLGFSTLRRASQNLRKSMAPRKARKCEGKLTFHGDPVVDLVMLAEDTGHFKPGDEVLRFAPIGNSLDSFLVISRRDSRAATSALTLIGLGYAFGTEKGFAIGPPKALLMPFPSRDVTEAKCCLRIKPTQGTSTAPRSRHARAPRGLRLRIDMLQGALLIKHFLMLKEVWRKGGNERAFDAVKGELVSQEDSPQP